jgi:hypothetical protein
MRLTGPSGRLGTHDKLVAGQRQHVPFLSGVEDVASGEHQLVASAQILETDTRDMITRPLDAHWSMTYQAAEPAYSLKRAQQILEHFTKDFGLGAQIAHPGCAGIEQRIASGRFGQTSRLLVTRPNRFSQLPVSGSGAGRLHPRVLVWWYRLARELATDPVPGFGQHDLVPQIACCQGRCHTAAAASHDQHVTGEFHELLSPSQTCRSAAAR